MRSAQTLSCLAMAAIAITTTAVFSQTKPIVYPTKGQSAQQQGKDEGECHSWAKTNTGVDPLALAAAPAPAPAPPPPVAVPGPQGERVAGAVRGAVGGAVIGEIADNDAGKGAAIGATLGTMAGGARQRQRQAAAVAAPPPPAPAMAGAQQQQALATFLRAYGACLEGRGYTVK